MRAKEAVIKHRVAVLLASRATESRPTEGGFQLLRDLSHRLADDASLAPTLFSSTAAADEPGRPRTIRVFRRPGWGTARRIEFMIGLQRHASRFPVVHTAHVPTRANAGVLHRVSSAARPRGTRFVQTVTSLPDARPAALDRLLWGDHVVCQTTRALHRVQELGAPASMIVPWPSPARVAPDPDRREATRARLGAADRPLVVFPGEFGRLAIGLDLTDCLSAFLGHVEDALVVLACRFDKAGVGAALAERFDHRVRSVGEIDWIVALLEAADLVVFPARRMAGKFQPPMVLLEALQLGTPVLASSTVELDDVSDPGWSSWPADDDWGSFAAAMAARLGRPAKAPRVADTHRFEQAARRYHDLYVRLASEAG